MEVLVVADWLVAECGRALAASQKQAVQIDLQAAELHEVAQRPPSARLDGHGLHVLAWVQSMQARAPAPAETQVVELVAA